MPTAELQRQHQSLLRVVAIDGPAAAGKSTVARGVAHNLGMRFVDTGLLYRAVTLGAIQQGISPEDGAGIASMADNATLELGPSGEVLMNGTDVSDQLRSSDVESSVSQVAAHPEVRRSLYQKQRRIALAGDVVMVGRDITTVIVPDAASRIYLDASLEERARRRFEEQMHSDPLLSPDTVLAELKERDRRDSTRDTAPLRAAEGAAIVETNGKTIQEVIEEVTQISRERLTGIALSATTRPDTASIPPEFLEGAGYSNRRKVVQKVNGWWIELLTDLQLIGEENIPPFGPLLFVSNHLHNTDPMIEYYGFPRPIHFMGKQELFRYPVIRQIAELSGGFPVDRGKVDREALRNAEERLTRGITVGMYPEGGRSPTGALIEGKAGAGMLALKTGAPVLPVAITGSERLPLNGKKGKAQRGAAQRDPGHKGVRMVYGQPFTIPRVYDGKKVSSDQATEAIMLEIARLLPADYRGVYAERLRTQKVRPIVPYDPRSSPSPAPSSSSSSETSG